MNFVKIFYKSIFTFLVIACFFMLATLINIFLPFSKFLKRRILTKLSAFHAKLMLKVIGFKLKLIGPKPATGVMIIGNHMSYLDILIYLSFFESLFVTSVDMKERLFLGQVTQLGGCLFVERRNPRNLPKEMKSIKKFFDKNFSVCIFPEGTSSNGETVLPFKNSMFQIPLETGCPIQPIVLKYKKIDSKEFSSKNCDLVCWYGDLGFFPHLMKLFTLTKVEAELEVLPQINSTAFKDRKSLSGHAHTLLKEKYHQD